MPGVGGAHHVRAGRACPFPSEIDHDGIEALGPLPVTPFADGVAASVAIYRTLQRSGRLDPAEHGPRYPSGRASRPGTPA